MPVSATDMRALGRLGTPFAGEPRARGASRGIRRGSVQRGSAVSYATARPIVPRTVLAVAGVAVVVLAWLATTAGSQVQPAEPLPATASPLADATTLAGRGAVTGARAVVPGRPGTVQAAVTTLPPFAVLNGLPLDLPAGDVALAAFREASQAEALTLTPVGTLVLNGNPETFAPPPDVSGTRYAVLPPVGGVRPATSAVDLLVPPQSAVRAPVSGTVVSVDDYPLPQGVRDWRIVIEPEARPDLRVVLAHLESPAVAAGARVAAGTELGTVRRLPFDTTTDQVNPDGLPYVRMFVRPGMTEQAPDPNAPAVRPRETLTPRG